MTVLLTGATGFIGRHVHQLLLQRGHEVVAVARTQQPDRQGRWLYADILQPGATDYLLDAVKPNRLIHLAWNATPGRFWTSLDNLDWLASSLALVRGFWARGGGRAVVAGTCAEYDWRGSGYMEENSVRAPATLYGCSKDSLNRLLSSLAAQEGHELAWGRVFWLYGPHEPPGRLVSDIAKALTNGTPVACGDGASQRDFLHVHDVARAFVDLAWSDTTGDVNISSGKAVRVRDVIETLGRISGRADLIRLGARKQVIGDPPVIVGRNNVLSQSLHFTPAYTLDSGLQATFDWWLEHQGK